MRGVKLVAVVSSVCLLELTLDLSFQTLQHSLLPPHLFLTCTKMSHVIFLERRSFVE